MTVTYVWRIGNGVLNGCPQLNGIVAMIVSIPALPSSIIKVEPLVV